MGPATEGGSVHKELISASELPPQLSLPTFFFRIVSNFNILKTLKRSVHAGLFCRFPSPPNCGMDYRIFNVRR